MVSIAAFVSPVLALWPAIAAVGSTGAIVALAVRKIGGVSGDVLGAIAVCGTLAALVTVVAAV